MLSVSGFKYYLVIIDDFSHYLWTFPLKFNLGLVLASSSAMQRTKKDTAASILRIIE
ncbi:hypothetical protein V2J09_018111 [Rumex salicifolius]